MSVRDGGRHGTDGIGWLRGAVPGAFAWRSPSPCKASEPSSFTWAAPARDRIWRVLEIDESINEDLLTVIASSGLACGE
jgi:hypothetical protein